ncbi:MAG: hypothetical protein ACHQF4_11020 [Sphingobacteriales bacterium]
MKKALLVLLLVGGVYQLRAQQFAPVNPSDSLLKRLLIKPMPFQLTKPLDKINLNNLLANASANNIDRMPVAVLQGHSKMPVTKLGGYYTMPVKKIGSEEVPGNFNGFPGLPTFKTP